MNLKVKIYGINLVILRTRKRVESCPTNQPSLIEPLRSRIRIKGMNCRNIVVADDTRTSRAQALRHVALSSDNISLVVHFKTQSSLWA